MSALVHELIIGVLTPTLPPMVDVVVMKKPRSGRAPVSSSDLLGRLFASAPSIAVDSRALLLLPSEDPSTPCACDAPCKKTKKNPPAVEWSTRLLAASSWFARRHAKTNFKMRHWVTARGCCEAGVHESEPGRENVSAFSLQCGIQREFQATNFSCMFWQGRK